MIKRTSLYEQHLKLGAKMVPFAGYEMPVSYPDGIKAEYFAVRQNVGIFDVSHMGEFFVGGKNCLNFLQYVTINDVSKLEVGDAQYSALCYSDGGIVDDLIIYRQPEGFMLVVNAANITKDFGWLKGHLTANTSLEDRSDLFSLIAVQGPESRTILAEYVQADLNLKFYSYQETVCEAGNIMLSRTGYTGELGFEIYCEHSTAKKVWDYLASREDVRPAGLAARDLLRMEMKYCLYGNDIDKTTNPIEAGLSWITALEKSDFIGRDALLKVKEKRPERRLVCFKMTERGIPRHGYEIRINGESAGIVTSGSQSPILKAGIGMGYVRSGLHKSGQQLEIMIRDNPVKAIIVKPPLIKGTSLLA